MFYYPHHIGDFVSATSRLSDSQSMAYLRLMWLYYETEKPLVNDIENLAFKVGSDLQTVKLILQNFFSLEGEFWIHSRCEAVLVEYKKKSEKAAASATARWNNARAMRTHSERNANESKNDANQKPITNNQKEYKTPSPPSGECVAFESFWNLWPKSERKAAKGKCQDVWRRGKLDNVANEISNHIQHLKTSEGWTKQGGQFIPSPLVYLNQRRWEGAETESSSTSLYLIGGV